MINKCISVSDELTMEGEWHACGEYLIARVVGLANSGFRCDSCSRKFVTGEIVVCDNVVDHYWCQECKKDVVLAYVW